MAAQPATPHEVHGTGERGWAAQPAAADQLIINTATGVAQVLFVQHAAAATGGLLYRAALLCQVHLGLRGQLLDAHTSKPLMVSETNRAVVCAVVTWTGAAGTPNSFCYQQTASALCDDALPVKPAKDQWDSDHVPGSTAWW